MIPKAHMRDSMVHAVMIVQNYIEMHPLEWKQLEDFTEKANVDRKKLQKAFKYHSGLSIREYQLQKRMETAARMLVEGRLTRKQIATHCGYNQTTNFSIAFKKVFKMSPREWLLEKSKIEEKKKLKKDKKGNPTVSFKKSKLRQKRA